MGRGRLLDGYIVQLRAEYSLANRARRAELLDRFVTVTGFHRKSAIRALNRPNAPLREVRQRPSRYEPATVQALAVIWSGLGRPCAKGLQPVLVEMAEVFARHEEITLTDTVRDQLGTMSAATIDRLLRPYRAAADSRDRRWRCVQRTANTVLAAVREAGHDSDLEALCQKLRVRTNLYSLLFQTPMLTRIRREGPPSSPLRPLEYLAQSDRVSAHQLAAFRQTYERINPARLLREIERLIETIQLATAGGEDRESAVHACADVVPIGHERIAG